MPAPDALTSPEALPGLYTRLYSERRFDAWRRLFDDAATVVRVDASGRRSSTGIDRAASAYARYAAGFRTVEETWRDVQVRVHGDLATVSARYTLTADSEVREGVDLLTLARSTDGWKIVSLVYQQTRLAVTSEDSASTGPHEPANLADLLSMQARRAPDGVAIRSARGALGFGRLDALVWRCAQRMAAQGVTAGDVVGLSFNDDVAAIVAMLATARIGATVVWIPGRAAPALRDAALAEVSARALMTDAPAGADAPVPALPLDLADLARARGPVDPRLRAARPAAPCMIITGSGSTGRPKKIPLSHGQLLGQMRAYREALGLHPGDRVASTMPIDSVVTLERYLEALLAGASVVLGGARDGDVPGWLARTGTTILWSTVANAETLLATGRRLRLGRAPASLRAFIVGSSTVGPVLRKRLLDEFTDRLHVYYGTNEAGLATMAGPQELRADPLTVGRAAPGVDVEVVAPDGGPVAPGEVGLVRIRAPGMATCYLDDPEGTSAAFRDGWFHPKDLGRLGPGGLLDHCGRADDLMIVDGTNVYPAEIERALASVQGVAEAVAVPVRHPVHQDIPVGVVTLDGGAGLDEATLLRRARDLLGPRAPALVVVLPEIPRNPQGKPLRSQLEEIADRRLRSATRAGG